MPQYPYLTRAGKRGVWRYRRSVPSRLRAVIGAREIIRSLRTTALAEALARYANVAAEAQQRLDKAEAALSSPEVFSSDLSCRPVKTPAGQSNTHGKLEPANYLRECEQREFLFRQETTRRVLRDPAAFLRGEIIALPMSIEQFYGLPQHAFMDDSVGAYKVLLAMAYRDRLRQRAAILRTHLQTCDTAGMSAVVEITSGLKLCPTCVQHVGTDLAKIELEFVTGLLAGAGSFPVSSRRGVTGAPDSAKGPTTAVVTLSQAVEAWIASGSVGNTPWSGERAALCKRVMQDFVALCGDKPLDEYRKSDGREFVAILRRLPANIEKRRLSSGTRDDLRKVADVAASKGLRPQNDGNIERPAPSGPPPKLV